MVNFWRGKNVFLYHNTKIPPLFLKKMFRPGKQGVRQCGTECQSGQNKQNRQKTGRTRYKPAYWTSCGHLHHVKIGRLLDILPDKE